VNDERPSPEQLFELVLDLAVYAPVGMLITVREQLPKRVRRGRQAMENRVQLARFIGQLAVQTGQREIAKRIEEQRAATSTDKRPQQQPSQRVTGSNEAPGGHMSEQTSEQTVASTPRPDDQPPRAADLPISDYESLAAIHVVERLRSMRPDEIELIRRFEVAHRSRRTIVAKIEQLQAR